MAIEIVSGCISSILVWWILNIILTPSLEIDDNIQYKRDKRYIRVKNRSWFNIYDVVCSVEFCQGSKKDSYKRTDSPLPFLEHCNGVYAIPLSGDEYTNRFFENIDEQSKVNITITYQNKFGVKKTINKRLTDKADFE